MYAHQTYLFALFAEVVDGFACGFGSRAHEDDDAVGFGISVVVEEAVLTTGELGDFGHVFFHHFRHRLVEGVGGFAVGKESFGVFGHTTSHRMFGTEGAGAEFAERFLIHEGLEVFDVEAFDLLNFV